VGAKPRRHTPPTMRHRRHIVSARLHDAWKLTVLHEVVFVRNQDAYNNQRSNHIRDTKIPPQHQARYIAASRVPWIWIPRLGKRATVHEWYEHLGYHDTEGEEKGKSDYDAIAE
jgi:hypothetical protein